MKRPTSVSLSLLLMAIALTGYSYDYPLIDTGQVNAYNLSGEAVDRTNDQTLIGQDADYSSSDFSFVNNGDGTITDLNTGLTWLQEPSSEKFDWQGAVDYCDELVYAGRSDWRTPSLKELITIEDFSQGWPYINTNYFTFGDRTIEKSLQFWSSNEYFIGTTHDGAKTSFGLNFATGHIKGYPAEGDITEPVATENSKTDTPPPGDNPLTKYVWAVAGDAYGINDFHDNGNGTVTDKATGLMWMQVDSGTGLDWENALSYSENLAYAGYTDWRLPNIKELQSIVDYSGVYPAITAQYFQVTDQDAYFWSSTSAYFSNATEEQSKYYWAWYVAFGYAVNPEGEDVHGAGAVRFDNKYEGGPAGEDSERIYNYARPVRTINTYVSGWNELY